MPVIAAGNAAEGIPRGNIRGGTQLAGRVLGRDVALSRARHMNPKASRQRDAYGAEQRPSGGVRVCRRVVLLQYGTGLIQL
jgi:hypothetical protein